ncbi:MAG: hypothetical protein HZA48_08490 [Planctomycetes bacterium]|nr:hypothetical protein [Planctomycetota bacterium]
MNKKIIERLEKEGKIRKQKAGFIQIEALLIQAIGDLKEAKKISNIAERATFLMAYMAMLKAGRALLLFNGYVPDDGAQHRTVIEMTSVFLGNNYSQLTYRFEIMRRKRNDLTYEAGIPLSISESQKSFMDSISLVKEILEKVRSQNPQMTIKFDLGS